MNEHTYHCCTSFSVTVREIQSDISTEENFECPTIKELVVRDNRIKASINCTDFNCGGEKILISPDQYRTNLVRINPRERQEDIQSYGNKGQPQIQEGEQLRGRMCYHTHTNTVICQYLINQFLVPSPCVLTLFLK